MQDIAHAAGVELVEDVVEQQQRHYSRALEQPAVQSEPQSYGEGLHLPLGAEAPQVESRQGEREIIAVWAY